MSLKINQLVRRTDININRTQRSFRTVEVQRSRSSFISRCLARGLKYSDAINVYDNSELRQLHTSYIAEVSK